MGLVDQVSAFLFAGFCRDKQNGGSAAQTRQIELVLIHHEFLVKNRQRDAALTGLRDEVGAAAEVLPVGEDAERRGAVPLVTQRNHGRIARLLDPPLRRRLPLELRDDAAGGRQQGRCHRHRLRARQEGFHPGLQSAQGNLPLPGGDFQLFVGGDFVEDVHLNCSVPRIS